MKKYIWILALFACPLQKSKQVTYQLTVDNIFVYIQVQGREKKQFAFQTFKHISLAWVEVSDPPTKFPALRSHPHLFNPWSLFGGTILFLFFCSVCLSLLDRSTPVARSYFLFLLCFKNSTTLLWLLLCFMCGDHSARTVTETNTLPWRLAHFLVIFTLIYAIKTAGNYPSSTSLKNFQYKVTSAICLLYRRLIQ